MEQFKNKDMKETLISFECAKLAKKKGFNIQTPSFYDTKGKGHTPDEQYYTMVESQTMAPTKSFLQKWLREEHNMQVFVIPFKDHAADVNDEYVYKYCILNNSIGSKFCKTYEEALEEALKEALKLIK